MTSVCSRVEERGTSEVISNLNPEQQTLTFESFGYPIFFST